MHLSICADDIGQDPSINEASLKLFSLGRLSQVSVLALAPFVKCAREDLLSARNNGLQIGLHLNLTLPFQAALYCQPLARLILLSQLRLLPTMAIEACILQQLQTFEDIFQITPDFIDGHQHIHQFPQIRDILIRILSERYPHHSSLWLRSTALPKFTGYLPQAWKSHTLNLLGGSQFLALLDKNNIKHNAGFLGVYGFNAPTQTSYQQLMQAWLLLANEGSLVMCHPANTAVANDGIGPQRWIEYQYLTSSAFGQDLEDNGITVRSPAHIASI